MLSTRNVKSCDALNKINSDNQALSPTLRHLLRKIIEKEHLTQYELTVKDFDTRGNNILGKLYEVYIKCVAPANGKDVNIFVKEKIMFNKPTPFNIEQAYANEVFVYKDLSKIIMRLQEKANVPTEERYKIAKAYDKTNNNEIILENLRQKGFTMYDKAEPVPLKYFELGVQELAKLHALSFVIEKELPEYFKENIAVLEIAFDFGEEWKGLMRNICRYVANLYDDETKIKIENFVPVLLEKLPRYYKDKTSVCTLNHGDYKKNNVMARIVNGEPVEVIAVDYQFIDYGCPIRDLLCFIFTGTDQEFRKKHLTNLKDLYFEKLSGFLNYFDIDVETVYPREQFEMIYTEWLDYGLMLMLLVSAFLFTPDFGSKVDNSSFSELPYRPNKHGKDLLKGIVDDFIRWGYL